MAEKIFIADKPTLDAVKDDTNVLKSDTNVIHSNVNAVKSDVGSNSDVASASGSVHAKLKDLKKNLCAKTFVAPGTFSWKVPDGVETVFLTGAGGGGGNLTSGSTGGITSFGSYLSLSGGGGRGGSGNPGDGGDGGASGVNSIFMKMAKEVEVAHQTLHMEVMAVMDCWHQVDSAGPGITLQTEVRVLVEVDRRIVPAVVVRGGCAIDYPIHVTPGEIITVTIGSGGAGGTGTNAGARGGGGFLIITF